MLYSFSWLNNIPSYGYGTFVYLPFVDRRLGCFCLLAVGNSAARNLHIHVSV